MGFWEEKGGFRGEVGLGGAFRSRRRGQIAVELQPTFIWGRGEFCRLSGVGFLAGGLTTADGKHTAAFFPEVKKKRRVLPHAAAGNLLSSCCRCQINARDETS